MKKRKEIITKLSIRTEGISRRGRQGRGFTILTEFSQRALTPRRERHEREITVTPWMIQLNNNGNSITQGRSVCVPKCGNNAGKTACPA